MSGGNDSKNGHVLSNEEVENNRYPSVDVILDEIKSQFHAQESLIESLETKSYQTLSNSTIVFSILSLSSGYFRTIPSDEVPRLIGDWEWTRLDTMAAIFLALAALVFLSSVICVFKAYKLRDYAGPPDAPKLARKYLGESPQKTKMTLIAQYAKAIEENAKPIKEKAKWARWAAWGIRAQVLAITLAVIVGLAINIWGDFK